MREHGWNGFSIEDFKEQAIGHVSSTEAAACVQVKTDDDRTFWGIGVDADISIAGLKAVVCAWNRSRAGIR